MKRIHMLGAVITVGAIVCAGITACAQKPATAPAYNLYYAEYQRLAGSADGAATNAEWNKILKDNACAASKGGANISAVKIQCGNVLLTYADGAAFCVSGVQDGLGHDWGAGETTAATCVSQGRTEYSCNICAATKTEYTPVDINAHGYQVTSAASGQTHGEECKFCGDTRESAHIFGTWSDRGEVNDGKKPAGKITARECPDCGYTQLKAAAVKGYKFLRWSSGETADTVGCRTADEAEKQFAYFAKDVQIQKLNVPVFDITTKDFAGIPDKENYVDCNVSLVNAEEKYCLENLDAGIRLRGNSTMRYPKKPYRIKFGKKQGLFGYPKNKSWVLLALYQDFSNIKDFAAFTVANAFKGVGAGNSMFVPNARHVELYLNGEYQGLYLLCDQVQENSGRVDVEEEFDQTATEVPFLVEMDDYAPYEGVENTDWFGITHPVITNYFNVKYPEADQRFSQSQFDYIKNYITTVDGLCRNPNVTRAQFEEYVDLASFIDYFLTQELMGQQEINKKSVYMSKKTGGKLVMGPVWDFDWAAGGPMNGNGAQHEPNRQIYSSNNWFGCMLKVKWFKQEVLNRLEQAKGVLNATLDSFAAYKAAITAVSERNAAMWDFDTDNSLPSFSEYYDTVINFICGRIDLIPIFLSYIN